MPERSDDELDEILRALPPAPAAWVSRAEELPQLERALAVLNERQEREVDAAAMRSALEAVGLEPDDERIRALARLRDIRSKG